MCCLVFEPARLGLDLINLVLFTLLRLLRWFIFMAFFLLVFLLLVALIVRSLNFFVLDFVVTVNIAFLLPTFLSFVVLLEFLV